MSDEETKQAPVLHVATGPHSTDTADTTRTMMRDVLIGLGPVVIAAVLFYREFALQQIIVCVLGCGLAEWACAALRGRKATLGDMSSTVTGLILALSLPWNCPIWVALIGSFVSIGLGKALFGGLGFNLFNPAMVGRAFVMLAFSAALGAPAYVMDIEKNPGNGLIEKCNREFGGDSAVDVLTGATPMTASKEGHPVPLMSVVVGSTYSSLGERGLIVLIGGLWLLFRKAADWRIPLAAVIAVGVIGGLRDVLGDPGSWYTTHQLFGGAFWLGALFIATDPVTSPTTPKGKWIFGLLFGCFVMLLRQLSNYPEGVMFSVLLVNAITPLINRWTVPKPFGLRSK